MARTYLDWNATAPLRPEARAAMCAAMDEVGNSSSVHAEGRRARAIIEQARGEVAALVGAELHNVIFTAGATEAAAMALTPDWGDLTFDRLLVSRIEHPCVLAGGQFGTASVFPFPVSTTGQAEIAALFDSVDAKAAPAVVALMLANNETGIIQPVIEAAQGIEATGGVLVCDATQAAGRIEVDIKALGADALLLSAHKLGGPKGVGALVLADETVAPAPLIRGGGQERGRRAGTENIAAIAGFGAAAKAALAGLADMPRVRAMRDRLEGRVSLPSLALMSSAYTGAQRLANTALLSLPGANAETLVIRLDLAGIAVSAGSACSSGKVKRSHVLDAMRIDPEIAAGTIRVSLGPTTTDDDIERFLAAWSDIASRHGARRAA